MIDLLEEAYEVSRKEGINLEPDFVRKNVAFINTIPYESTPSLARDVWHGRPSKIEYQNGTVVKLAQKHDMDAP